MASVPVILVTCWAVIITDVVFIVVGCSQQAVLATWVLKVEEG